MWMMKLTAAACMAISLLMSCVERALAKSSSPKKCLTPPYGSTRTGVQRR